MNKRAVSPSKKFWILNMPIYDFFFPSLLKGNSMWNLHRIYATNHYTIKHSQFQAFLFWFEIAPNQQSKEPGVSNFSYYVTAWWKRMRHLVVVHTKSQVSTKLPYAQRIREFFCWCANRSQWKQRQLNKFGGPRWYN